MEKLDFRTIPSNERYQFRKRAINLIKLGEKKKVIAKMFGVRDATITEWVKKHKEYGNAGLKDKTRGVKSEDKKLLSSIQEKQVQKMILDTMPDQLKLPYALWTRKAVKDLVKRELGVVLAINTMGDYL
jgi:transposase